MIKKNKILATWILSLILLRTLLEFPHRDIHWIGLVNVALQMLLCIISVALFRSSQGGQKLTAFNFALFFGFSIPLLLSSYAGESFLTDNPYVQFYTHLYINKIAHIFIFLLTIIFLGIDYLVTRLTPGRKYLVAVALSVGVMAPFYSGYVLDPYSLARSAEFQQLLLVREVRAEFPEGVTPPAPGEIADILVSTGRAQGDAGQATAMVEKILPYLDGGGDTTLFWKPIELLSVYANALCLAFVIFLLARMYGSGKPNAAYLDKILLAFGLFHVLEIMHGTGYVYSVRYETYSAFLGIGQYFTVLCFLSFMLLLSLKLRFMARGAGRYYERVIVTHPGGVTRLVDEIDRVILRSFFGRTDQDRLGDIAPGKKGTIENES